MNYCPRHPQYEMEPGIGLWSGVHILTCSAHPRTCLQIYQDEERAKEFDWSWVDGFYNQDRGFSPRPLQ